MPMRTSGSPQSSDADDERRGESRQSSEREGRDRPDEGSDAEGGVQESDAGVADVEQLDGHDDEQDRVRAGDERLRREERRGGCAAGQSPATVRKPANASERKCARSPPLRRALPLRGSARRPRTRASTGRRSTPSRRRRSPCSPAARSRPARAGPTNRPMLSSVLTTAFAAVSSPGVLASDGRQRGQGGAERRRDDHGRPRRSRRPSLPAASSEDAARLPRDEAGADQVRDDHHALARVAIGERRGERRDQRGRDRADHDEHTDGLRAALRCTRRPRLRRGTPSDRGPTSAHAELDPPEVRVPEDVFERRRRVAAAAASIPPRRGASHALLHD